MIEFPNFVQFDIPVKTVNESNNSHGHWSVVANRRKGIRRASWLLCPPFDLPCVVAMTRLSAGTLDDDGLQSALKSVRDGIADRLGVADNTPLVEWLYGQGKAPRGSYGVRVVLQSGPPVCP